MIFPKEKWSILGINYTSSKMVNISVYESKLNSNGKVKDNHTGFTAFTLQVVRYFLYSFSLLSLIIVI